MNALAPPYPPYPPFPANPKVGEFFGTWCWNGSWWVPAAASGMRTVRQVFLASGTYQPSPGLITVDVECIGGGGGGGGVHTTSAANLIFAGGAGGGGGYSKAALPAALVLGGVVVTVGAGGGYETIGGTTSFGALCVATGGYGGQYNDATTVWGLAGSGATTAAAVGDVTFPGCGGQSGVVISPGTVTQQSYPTPLGGQMFGGASQIEASPLGAWNGPTSLPNTGAGGGGGVVNQKTGAIAQGGPGGSGLVIATEYCWSADGGGVCQAPVPSVGWGGPC